MEEMEITAQEPLEVTSEEPMLATRDSFMLESTINHISHPAFKDPESEVVVKMRSEMWSSICLGRAMEVSTWLAQTIAQTNGSDEPVYEPSELSRLFEMYKDARQINGAKLILSVEPDDTIPYEVVPSISAPWWLHSLKSEVRLVDRETGEIKVIIKNIVYH